MGCCYSSLSDANNIRLGDDKGITDSQPCDDPPLSDFHLQQSVDLERNSNPNNHSIDSSSFLTRLSINPSSSLQNSTNLLSILPSQQQLLPTDSENLSKSVKFFGGLAKKAALTVKEQGENLELDKKLVSSINLAGETFDKHAGVVGNVIKDGIEQSSALVMAQVAIVKDGLDDAIKAIKDLKIQKRVNDIIFPVLRKVFVHSVTGFIEDRYQVFEILGKGSHSTVRKVKEKMTGIDRAAKMIVKNSINEHQTSNLISEIETLKSLDHPNIVRVIEIVEEVSKLCIITELCSGGELFDRIVKLSNFDELMASKIMYQLLSGLIHIHKNGFIHRDLKPENLMFSDMDSETIKIIDFGISKIGNELLRKKSSCVGSAYYLAPEAINGFYDFKSDIWSCGVILYILLCGKPPFAGNNEQEIFTKSSRGVFNFSDRKWKNISQEVKDLICKMLNKDINKRFTATEAFNHPWVQNSINRTINTSLISPKVLNNLTLFRANTMLQQATLSYIASNMMSGQEIKELREAFIVLDVDGDGQLTKEELKRGFGNITISTCLELEDILKSCDIDMNGMIDYSEFITATLDWQQHLSQDMLEKAFKVFDVDKSGSISIREIKQFLGVEDENDNDMWSTVLKDADINGDGEIDMDEFKQLMLKLCK